MRRLGTSPVQFYRLLDPTSHRESVEKMLTLLRVVNCEIEVILRTRSA